MGTPLVAVALVIAAAVSIGRPRRSSGTAEPLWVLIVLVFPVVDPVLRFGIGSGCCAIRRHNRETCLLAPRRTAGVLSTRTSSERAWALERH